MEETGQPTAFDQDPAASFLAREQDELAGIADDTLGIGIEVCDVNACFVVWAWPLTFSLVPGRPRSSYNRRTVRRRKRFVWNSYGERYLKEQGGISRNISVSRDHSTVSLVHWLVCNGFLFVSRTDE